MSHAGVRPETVVMSHAGVRPETDCAGEDYNCKRHTHPLGREDISVREIKLLVVILNELVTKAVKCQS